MLHAAVRDHSKSSVASSSGRDPVKTTLMTRRMRWCVQFALSATLVAATCSLMPWSDRAVLADGRSGSIAAEDAHSVTLRIGGANLNVNRSLLQSRVRGLRSLVAALRMKCVLVALSIHLILVVLLSWRWHILLQSAGVSVCVLETLHWNLQATAADAIGLGQVGYEAYRAALAAPQAGWAKACLVQIQEKILGVSALVGMAILGFVLIRHRAIQLPELGVRCGSSLAVGLIVLLVLALVATRLRRRAVRWAELWNRTHSFLRSTWQSLVGMRKLPVATVTALGLSAMAQLAIVAFYRILAMALGYDLPLSIWIAVVPVVGLLTALPLTVSGIGVFEAVMIALLTACSPLQTSDVLAICALHRFMAIPIRALVLVALIMPSKPRNFGRSS